MRERRPDFYLQKQAIGSDRMMQHCRKGEF
jgi:hypothetical protein